MHSLDFSPIGFIASCYKEKFGIPRQPSLVTAAKSQLQLSAPFTEESIRGLDGFSHIWLQFVFHQTQQQGWKSMVKPPRLGGNEKIGVFASRSTFRPNPIGLSVVKLERIEIRQSKVVLHLLGCDLVDGTPILDIKPYLPYVDAISDAQGGFAKEKPENKNDVYFSDKASEQCAQASERLNEDMHDLIVQILQLDPRPAYQQNTPAFERVYAMKLHDFDLKWQYSDKHRINVLSITQV